jgi:DNA-directed RNA polymerase subunit E'/Rpb7
MFVLVQIRDTIKVPPCHFGKDPLTALTDEIHKKYSNRVIANTGLCICVYDIESYGDPLLYPGDAATHTLCVFRLVVFRPFRGEILLGKVTTQDRTGLVGTSSPFRRTVRVSTRHVVRDLTCVCFGNCVQSCQTVSLGFSIDVFVPAADLQDPSELYVAPFFDSVCAPFPACGYSTE